MVRERVLRLSRQGDPVHQKQHAGHRASFEEPFDERSGRSRLAGPGRHLDQQVAASVGDFAAERVDALDLVVAIHDPPVGLHCREVAANAPGGHPSLQVVLRIEARDLARVCVGRAVEKPHFLAV